MRNYFLSHVYDLENEGGAPKEPGAKEPGAKQLEAEGTKAADGKEKPEPKKRADSEVFQDRIGHVTRLKEEEARGRAAEKVRADKLETELRAARELIERQGKTPEGDNKEAKPADQPRPKFTPLPDLDELLETPEAKKKIDARAEANARAKDISRRGDEIYDAAMKEFGDTKLTKALGNFKAFDGLRDDLAEAIFDTPNPHKVLYEIASNPATIEKLYGMKEVRMGAEVQRIADRVNAPQKQLSKVPEPPEELGGRVNTGPVDLADKELPMAKWVEEREKDLKKRGVRL